MDAKAHRNNHPPYVRGKLFQKVKNLRQGDEQELHVIHCSVIKYGN